MSVSLPLSRSFVRPSRKPLLDLLEQPTVAVGIAERGIRGIGAACRIWTESARRGSCVKAAGEATFGVVEHVAYLDAMREELAAGRVYVVHYQSQAVDGARLGESDSLAKMIDAPEPGGVNCIIR